ncbi:MAG: aldo/keto reductase [Coriobacteriales bacterium]|nr:aldo/keto reductase [Coriobacteriales bacterium]
MGYLGEDTCKLGFGLMRLPRLEDQTIDVTQVAQMADEFLAAGGTYFDTAWAYDGSEEAIRTALVERHPRESYTLATKNAAWLGPKSAQEAQAQLQVSLDRLGTDYVDYYLLHNLGATRTKFFEEWGMWEWALQQKREGKIRHLGFSFHDNAQTLDQILAKHAQDAEFVQLQINYADWEDGSVQSRRIHEVARSYDKPVVIMEPVKGGTLAAPPEPVAQILAAADPNRTPVEWALRFALNTEGLIACLSGMSSLEQMRQNLQTLERLSPLTQAELDTLAAARAALARLIAVPCTGCHYCMEDCPVNMPISSIMESLNRAALYGEARGKRHYGFSTSDGARASDCIQCAQCESACPQQIDIVHQLEVAASKFE